MAGTKETPRQKMIGMMYLVLTAMLALNVSSEILNAFKIVDDSILETNRNFERKINETYDSFYKAVVADSAKTIEWFNKAEHVKKLTDELVDSLVNIRSRLVYETEPRNDYYVIDGVVNWDSLRNITTSHLQSLDKNDVPNRYFMGDGSNGVAFTMRKMFEDYRREAVSVLKPEEQTSILQKIGLNTEGPESGGKYRSKNKGKIVNWEEYFFGETILGADIVILNNFIQEARNAEFDILSILKNYVGATDFKFNAIDAKVIPDSKIVSAGDSYHAYVSVVAYDSMSAPEVYYKMGARQWDPSMEATASKSQSEGGLSFIRVPAGAVGEHYFAGVIKVKQPDGTTKDYTFNDAFYVQAKGGGSVVNDELKVLYMGYDNSITINMPGARPESISCRITSGSASTPQRNTAIQGRAVFKIKPNGLADIVIVGESSDGGRTEPTTFKVREMPAPLVYLGGRTEPPPLSKSAILAAGRLDASLGPDFLLSGDQFKYTITEFTMTYSRPGGGISTRNIKGGSFNQEAKNFINEMPANTIVNFHDIKVKGPDGRVKNSQNSISCTIL